ncbi:Gldg family protein [Pseudopontixanthobacter vadosimaris]|uniref:Gldg family protein n=1 Tax=Pseudopontixanthobacter vadosimaris TaxID=2726450 RepID=UPI001474F36A|nr:ABC transporter [Pseudopontixanthobacter vadosimaris]
MRRCLRAGLHALLAPALLAGCSANGDAVSGAEDGPASGGTDAAVTDAERRIAGGADRPVLGLLTTLPIYWAENATFSDALDSDVPVHWARRWLARRYDLQPVDALEADTLAALDHLLLVQPRALGGAENVALDDWVRKGGEVLLFADPRLTGHSIYPIGDRRRPQDVVLLSPILTRWGLELTFDEAQPLGESSVNFGERPLPTELAGRLRPVTTSADAPSDCRIVADALVALCRIGAGRAVIVADAALLEDRDDRRQDALRAFDALLQAAFDPAQAG